MQVCIPQTPHPCVAPGEHTPPPEQVPQVQEEVQVWVPLQLQLCDEPGEHTP